MFNRFINRELLLKDLDKLQIITDPPGTECRIHAVRVPGDFFYRNIPLYLRAMDFDLLYYNKSKEKAEINIASLNMNSLYIDFMDLTSDIYDYCKATDAELNVAFYTSYADKIGVKLSTAVKKITSGKMLDRVTLVIDTKVTQKTLIELFSEITYNITIYTTIAGILQMDPIILAGMLNGKKKKKRSEAFKIKESDSPEPVFQNSIGILQNYFNIKIIAYTSGNNSEYDRGLNTEPYEDFGERLIPLWLFERMTVESNTLVYNRKEVNDVFPSRIDNMGNFDTNLPTVILTNSRFDLMLCYNMYLFEEYLKVYLELYEKL